MTSKTEWNLSPVTRMLILVSVLAFLFITRPWSNDDLLIAVTDYVMATAWVIVTLLPRPTLRVRTVITTVMAIGLFVMMARSAWHVWGS